MSNASIPTDEGTNFDFSYLNIVFAHETSLFPIDGSVDSILEIEGIIFLNPDSGEKIKVGRIRGAILQGAPGIWDDADSIENDLIDCVSEFFTLGGEWVEELEWTIGADLLLIRNVEIDPDYRGNKFGLAAMLRFIDTFARGCGYAACKPFPEQFTGKVTKENEREFNEGMSKLTKYWKRLGFQKRRGKEYLTLNLDYKRPTFQSLQLEEPHKILKKIEKPLSNS